MLVGSAGKGRGFTWEGTRVPYRLFPVSGGECAALRHASKCSYIFSGEARILFPNVRTEGCVFLVCEAARG